MPGTEVKSLFSPTTHYNFSESANLKFSGVQWLLSQSRGEF